METGFQMALLPYKMEHLLYRQASNTFKTPLPQKVSSALHTDLTKPWNLWLRGLWSQIFGGSNPSFPTYQLYDFGQIINLAVFEFPLRRFLPQKAVARRK